MSNSFASALWALTNAYDLAVGTYGGGLLTIDYSSDGSPYYADTYTKGYSAIIDTAKYAWANPMLAGIALVNTIGPGTMKSCTASIADLRIRCYGIKSQKALRVILVNGEPSKDATVKVILSEAGIDATSIELSGPSLSETSAANLTIQGTSFSAPSPFSSRPPVKENLVAGTNIQTRLPSHSIKVITVEAAPSSK